MLHAITSVAAPSAAAPCRQSAGGDADPMRLRLKSTVMIHCPSDEHLIVRRHEPKPAEPEPNRRLAFSCRLSAESHLVRLSADPCPLMASKTLQKILPETVKTAAPRDYCILRAQGYQILRDGNGMGQQTSDFSQRITPPSKRMGEFRRNLRSSFSRRHRDGKGCSASEAPALPDCT